MKNFSILIIFISCFLTANESIAQADNNDTKYTYKRGDYNGIGKWYMGREVAYVMGFQGINWLERSEREIEEDVSTLIKNMEIKTDDTIADIGAGSGYHVFRMAPLAENGLVYAVDIQPEMLEAIELKKRSKRVSNVETVLGSEKSINLPKNSLDKILLVDVYHEFSYPAEMVGSIKNALKSNGQLFLIEYRGEDSSVPIKKIHKMTVKQSIKEMEAAGFRLKENIDNLPWQHCMIFEKKQ
ncbi:class I SAM-dependent methyltransferase [Flavobacteriaceae bacterium]|nr:class I SAM-dependent methyltransferase [Flavobacteriaceae bacterium]MDA9157738.1 class I SAM-dependent methyltransferase [Flavobacteriaceae bacterium]MDA9833083.1 class I SAM-dependent methyltransferase [Flavobacteriaceae bacterium]MDB4159651.1 class I SAM-dependent methyltransferase [Flavobacteriaceae bacterium]MDB4269528.1 class I SAM-dependent methyltransferase [Flavobacteriaceae bacterium]